MSIPYYEGYVYRLEGGGKRYYAWIKAKYRKVGDEWKKDTLHSTLVSTISVKRYKENMKKEPGELSEILKAEDLSYEVLAMRVNEDPKALRLQLKIKTQEYIDADEGAINKHAAHNSVEMKRKKLNEYVRRWRKKKAEKAEKESSEEVL
jgi:hypothetical protein